MPDKWPCCSGTTPQVVADYSISAYLQSESGIHVSLFTPSQVNWKAGGIPAKLIQTTSYPETDSIELRVETAAPSEFTIFVRNPCWLKSRPQLAVNGKTVDVAAELRTFAAAGRRMTPSRSGLAQSPAFWALRSPKVYHLNDSSGGALDAAGALGRAQLCDSSHLIPPESQGWARTTPARVHRLFYQRERTCGLGPRLFIHGLRRLHGHWMARFGTYRPSIAQPKSRGHGGHVLVATYSRYNQPSDADPDRSRSIHANGEAFRSPAGDGNDPAGCR